MPVHEFTKTILDRTREHGKTIPQLSDLVGVDPLKLEGVINGKRIALPSVVRGLARALELDEKRLEELAIDIRKRRLSSDLR